MCTYERAKRRHVTCVARIASVSPTRPWVKWYKTEAATQLRSFAFNTHQWAIANSTFQCYSTSRSNTNSYTIWLFVFADHSTKHGKFLNFNIRFFCQQIFFYIYMYVLNCSRLEMIVFIIIFVFVTTA